MNLHAIDVGVIFAVMVAVTWLGHRLSGSVTSRAAFFQGDGKLPWWAVSASIIATLVSAVTFVSVPANVFAPGGDLKYFQVVLGLALGKIAVGVLLARAFYAADARSSYEYIGQRTDRRTGELSMFMGLVLTVINAGVKLLTASLVLDVISGWGIPICTLFVVAVSVVWSAIAGIKTVIWTDFLLFVLFAFGALYIVGAVFWQLPVNLSEAWVWLDTQAKLVLFDFSTDVEKRYTIWAGVIGGIALNIAQGSTQGTWQRVKACRSANQAQRAYNFAALFYVVHLVILGVGLVLALFYAQTPLPVSVEQTLVSSPDRILPYFIVSEVPVGLSGLLIAAIFAAAISTLDSALAEAADISLTHLLLPFMRVHDEAYYVVVSRLLIVVWGGVFFVVALFFARFQGQGLLDLTFKLPNYVYGAIFGTILLARMGIGRFPSIVIGAVTACAATLWLANSGVAFFYWCPIAGLIMILLVVGYERGIARR